MNNSDILILGANGQLGNALKQKYPNAVSSDIDELDVTNIDSVESYNWSQVKIIINAAAYTNVDGAETPDGRLSAWKVNAVAPSYLSRVASKNSLTLVHISTDYVFDGSNSPHTETEQYSPLSVYGSSKAAGDIAVSMTPKHYILRTSWVIGEGKNFVRTMLGLGKNNVDPSVVSDQKGRLTFTSELVRAIDHLLANNCDFGTYNITNDGKIASWADITRQIFKNAGLINTVTDVSTEEYYVGKPGVASRPLNSELDLSKIKSTGFSPRDWQEDLADYVKRENIQ